MRKMIQLRLYEDGTYTVKDIGPDNQTQLFYGWDGDRKKGHCNFIEYYCFKSKKDYYLQRLVKKQLADIDEKMAELKKKKKAILNLKLTEVKE